MQIVVVLAVAAASLLIGFIVGNRFGELDMSLRERRVARQRRELREALTELRSRGAPDRAEARSGVTVPPEQRGRAD